MMKFFTKYSKLHNNSFPELTTKLNIVKISQNKLAGYSCTFSNE